jgi:phage tail-like protein
MSVPDLIPPNSGTFERAIAEGMNDVLPVPLCEILDPATTPERFLPFLAAHRSVDLWFSDWTVERKRQMIAEAIQLARIKGTRAATLAFLAYVDAQLVDIIAHPKRFVIGRSTIERDPIGHKPFSARHLIKIETTTPPRAFVMGRAVIGRARFKTPSREPFERALSALRVSKAPETEYRVDFAHKRQWRLEDNIPLGDGVLLGAYLNRTRL